MSVQFPPNSPLQQDLFLSPTKVQSPDKLFTWNVRQSPGGTIDPTPTKEVWDKMVEAGMTGDNIYRIQHTESKRRYIGSALETEKGNHIKKRFSKYKCNTNQYNQKKVAGDKLKQKLQHIEYAMARSPDKMNVAILWVKRSRVRYLCTILALSAMNPDLVLLRIIRHEVHTQVQICARETLCI